MDEFVVIFSIIGLFLSLFILFLSKKTKKKVTPETTKKSNLEKIIDLIEKNPELFDIKVKYSETKSSIDLYYYVIIFEETQISISHYSIYVGEISDNDNKYSYFPRNYKTITLDDLENRKIFEKIKEIYDKQKKLDQEKELGIITKIAENHVNYAYIKE